MEDCKLTIIAPCRNEGTFIRNFLDNMLSQDFPMERSEILVVDGRSDDDTQMVIREYCDKYRIVRLLINEEQTVPFALNRAIEESRGEFIVRVDLHATYPRNYLSELVHNIEALGADNVGGVCRTLAAKDTPICRAIATVMSNGFGVGNSYFRIGVTKTMRVDTVPFGCFRRELFDRIGMFDEQLTRNQDDEFNGRIIKNGGSIYLIANLNIAYYARDTVAKMAKMFYQYGLFKPLVNKKLGSAATMRQFVPLCFLLGVIGGGVLSIFSDAILLVYLAFIALYVVSAIYFTRHHVIKEPLQMLLLPWLFFVVHVSYGWGYLCGIFRFIILDKHTVKVKISR